MAALGLGLLSWCLIGAVLLGRLALGPPLPSALVPTLAILSAPPAVLGNALHALGDATGPVQQLILGTFVLLVGVQLVLVPRYAALPFGLGWWAYTFTVAASATYAIRWLSATDDPLGRALSWLVVVLATTVIGSIAAASLTLPRRTSRRDLSKEHA
ncbi:hypothetical protein [Nocardioides mangrovi]|uniref:SLAC1 family transporter n=1 Tax=Nocardioides mangrovi TaxID=2874580 RepID=UPI0021E12CC2|nr:hypothetical protein [Nocardioides mangrovi]